MVCACHRLICESEHGQYKHSSLVRVAAQSSDILVGTSSLYTNGPVHQRTSESNNHRDAHVYRCTWSFLATSRTANPRDRTIIRATGLVMSVGNTGTAIIDLVAGYVTQLESSLSSYVMMSSIGNIFRVTGPLCGEFTGHRWIPRTKASDAELGYFLWSAPWINGWVNNCGAGDLRRHHVHYDVIVMIQHGLSDIRSGMSNYSHIFHVVCNYLLLTHTRTAAQLNRGWS